MAKLKNFFFKYISSYGPKNVVEIPTLKRRFQGQGQRGGGQATKKYC